MAIEGVDASGRWVGPKLDRAKATLLHTLVQAGYLPVEPPILQEAATFLDLGGEDIRARLYLTSEGSGADLCLRPEYTIPACRAYLDAGGAGEPAAFCYCGPVFRQQPGRSGESLQAGLESFGRSDVAAADAEILSVALEAAAAAGAPATTVTMGDAGLMTHFLDAIDLPPLWQRRLRRGLERGRSLDDILSGAPSPGGDRSGVVAALAGADGKDAKALVEDLLSIAGIAAVGGRSVGEIAERFLIQVAQQSSAGFGGERRAVLARFLDIGGNPDRALVEIRRLGRDAGLDLGPSLDLFDERTGFIAAHGIDVGAIAFRTAFARKLDYYTGFVFEARAAGRGGRRGAGRRRALRQARSGARKPGPDPRGGGGDLGRTAEPGRRPVTGSATAPFVLAVPSKGRLQDNAAQFFARAGMVLVQPGGARDYRGKLPGFPGLEIAFLPVSEIVAALAEGQAHLGVAGEDLLRESVPDTDQKVTFLAPLGFGNADVVVAVPRAWIDVRSMADLEDVAALFHARRGRRMRVATKYVRLTRGFFAARGVSDYRIVESLGATEGAPASGGAELIVDITTTGATLAANGLKVLDDGIMLRSEANLVASRRADWSDGHRRTARAILARIAAEEDARTSRDVRAVFAGPVPDLEAEADERFGARRLGIEQGRLSLLCARSVVPDVADWLIERGAVHVAVTALDYVFAAHNPLYDKLLAGIA